MTFDWDSRKEVEDSFHAQQRSKHSSSDFSELSERRTMAIGNKSLKALYRYLFVYTMITSLPLSRFITASGCLGCFYFHSTESSGQGYGDVCPKIEIECMSIRRFSFY